MEDQLTKKELKIVDKTIDQALEKLKKESDIKKVYSLILSQAPPKEIVKHHDFGNFDYLPITAVERLLDGLFETWRPKILREGVAINGFYVVVELHSKIPGTEIVMEADGIGFAEFQTKQGSSPTDFTNLMQSAGVLAVPRARAEAIKNAAKTYGNLFGRNLARKDDRVDAETSVVNVSRLKIGKALNKDES